MFAITFVYQCIKSYDTFYISLSLVKNKLDDKKSVSSD